MYTHIYMQTEVAKWSPPLCSEPGGISEFEGVDAAVAVVSAPGWALPRLPGLGMDAFSEQVCLSVHSFALPCSFQLASFLQQS